MNFKLFLLAQLCRSPGPQQKSTLLSPAGDLARYFAGLGRVYGANPEKAAQLLAGDVAPGAASPLPGRAWRGS